MDFDQDIDLDTTRKSPYCSFESNSTRNYLDIQDYQWLEIKQKKEKPCTSLQNVNVRYEELPGHIWNEKSDWGEKLEVTIRFPRYFKEIKEVRSVDLETLIGMIGTYIGLFTGNQMK